LKHALFENQGNGDRDFRLFAGGLIEASKEILQTFRNRIFPPLFGGLIEATYYPRAFHR